MQYLKDIYLATINKAHAAADELISRAQQEAQSRSPNDDFARLSFEVGYLGAIIRNLMVERELNKANEVPNLPREPENA